MSITGFPEHRPVRSGMALTDLCDGLLPAQRILICVDRAGTVRRGPMGLHGATRGSDLHARFPARYLINGDVAKPAGKIIRRHSPGPVPIADGKINICADSEVLRHSFWESTRFSALLRP
jgi:crotonobetainyl-CoA:carnitine CoA-transferase CaiB-like acyl-CoA transferase